MGLCEGGRNQQILDGNDLIWLALRADDLRREIDSRAVITEVRGKGEAVGMVLQ